MDSPDEKDSFKSSVFSSDASLYSSDDSFSRKGFSSNSLLIKLDSSKLFNCRSFIAC